MDGRAHLALIRRCVASTGRASKALNLSRVWSCSGLELSLDSRVIWPLRQEVMSLEQKQKTRGAERRGHVDVAWPRGQSSVWSGAGTVSSSREISSSDTEDNRKYHTNNERSQEPDLLRRRVYPAHPDSLHERCF